MSIGIGKSAYDRMARAGTSVDLGALGDFSQRPPGRWLPQGAAARLRSRRRPTWHGWLDASQRCWRRSPLWSLGAALGGSGSARSPPSTRSSPPILSALARLRNGTRGQRAEPKAIEPTWRERIGKFVRISPASASRSVPSSPIGAAATRRSAYASPPGSRIEPLQVVDRHQQRSLLGQRPERREHRCRQPARPEAPPSPPRGRTRSQALPSEARRELRPPRRTPPPRGRRARRRRWASPPRRSEPRAREPPLFRPARHRRARATSSRSRRRRTAAPPPAPPPRRRRIDRAAPAPAPDRPARALTQPPRSRLSRLWRARTARRLAPRDDEGWTRGPKCRVFQDAPTPTGASCSHLRRPGRRGQAATPDVQEGGAMKTFRRTKGTALVAFAAVAAAVLLSGIASASTTTGFHATFHDVAFQSSTCIPPHRVVRQRGCRWLRTSNHRRPGDRYPDPEQPLPERGR